MAAARRLLPVLLAALAACSAGTTPAPQADAHAPTAATALPGPAAPAGADAGGFVPGEYPAKHVAPPPPVDAVPAHPPPAPARPRKVRTGGPLPPQRVPEPVRVDRSCGQDSDCVVKDIGSCCGRFPACVNRDSPADPAAVQARCARDGMASTCGFQEIRDCACRQGECVARDVLGVVR